MSWLTKHIMVTEVTHLIEVTQIIEVLQTIESIKNIIATKVMGDIQVTEGKQIIQATKVKLLPKMEGRQVTGKTYNHSNCAGY